MFFVLQYQLNKKVFDCASKNLSTQIRISNCMVIWRHKPPRLREEDSLFAWQSPTVFTNWCHYHNHNSSVTAQVKKTSDCMTIKLPYFTKHTKLINCVSKCLWLHMPTNSLTVQVLRTSNCITIIYYISLYKLTDSIKFTDSARTNFWLHDDHWLHNLTDSIKFTESARTNLWLHDTHWLNSLLTP